MIQFQVEYDDPRSVLWLNPLNVNFICQNTSFIKPMTTITMTGNTMIRVVGDAGTISKQIQEAIDANQRSNQSCS